MFFFQAHSAISNTADDFEALDFGSCIDFTDGETKQIRVVQCHNSTEQTLRLISHYKLGEDWMFSKWVTRK